MCDTTYDHVYEVASKEMCETSQVYIMYMFLFSLFGENMSIIQSSVSWGFVLDFSVNLLS